MRDRVCQQVAQRLRETVGVGPQCARRDGAELEAAIGERHDPLPQLGHERHQIDRLQAQELRVLAACEQQQVVDQAAHARDLALHQPLHPAHLLG